MDATNSYEARAKVLAGMGFACYQDYLASGLWKNIRRLAYIKRGNRCVRCQDPAQAIHHADYTFATLNGDSFRQLFPVCHKCHEAAEVDVDGRKRTTAEANDFLGVASFIDRALSAPKRQLKRSGRKGKKTRKRRPQRTKIAPVGWRRKR